MIELGAYVSLGIGEGCFGCVEAGLDKRAKSDLDGDLLEKWIH